jgi:kynurenine formamidase
VKRYIKLSYNIGVDTPLYPETPPVVIEKVKEISKGNSCNTFLITLSNHLGTHIDTPGHFFNSGRTISEYSIEELVFQKPLIVDCPKGINEVIEIDDIASSMNSNDSDILLIRTGFYKYRKDDIHTYCYKNPYLSLHAAEYLRKTFSTLKAIGIDCISIASYEKREIGREVHKTLLNSDEFKGSPIPIIEDLYLPHEIKELDELIISPIFIEGVDSAPCTVIGIIQD